MNSLLQYAKEEEKNKTHAPSELHFTSNSINSIKFEIPIHIDAWMLNGIETLYTLLNDLKDCKVELESDRLKVEIFDLESFLKIFAGKIEDKQNKVIFVKKLDNKGQEKFIKKDFVLIQYGKAINGKNVLKEKIYLETEKRLKDIFLAIKKGNKTCILCERKFKKSVDKLKQAVHPFATKIKSLSGVRTLKENYDNLCPLCYLIGTLEWLDEAILYRCSLGSGKQTYSVIFLPFELNLKKLHECKVEYRKILKSNINSPVSNLLKIVPSSDGKEKKIGYEGEYTTILKFFERFVKEILGEYGRDNFEEIDEIFGYAERKFCKSWIMLKIPSGNVKNIKLSRLDLNNDFIKLLIDLERKDIFIYDNIVDKIGVRDKNGKFLPKETSETKEYTAKTVIFDNFRDFSRMFLPRKNIVKYHGNLKDLDELIKLWRLMPMKLDENLKDIKDAAKTLAKLLKNHLSILYEMNKARTKEEFIRIYQQACRRLLGVREEERTNIYPPALEKFADLLINSSNNEWKTLRDVLLIYTSIYISRGEYKNTFTGEENEGNKP